jgi:hypothetical protein
LGIPLFSVVALEARSIPTPSSAPVEDGTSAPAVKNAVRSSTTTDVGTRCLHEADCCHVSSIWLIFPISKTGMC